MGYPFSFGMTVPQNCHRMIRLRERRHNVARYDAEFKRQTKALQANIHAASSHFDSQIGHAISR